MESIESKVESLASTILKTDAESWEIRNKAIIQLTELVAKFQDEDEEAISERFTANIFRLLKDPVKNMILDLRSQQVRDTCQFLIKLSDVVGDRMKSFLRDTFSTILEGVKIPHKVTSGYIDECIVHLIKRVTFKSGIVLVVHEIKESKAKVLRERCLEYVNLILMHWDMTDKELDFFVEAIKLGLEDAAVRAREIARSAYMNMFNLYPEKAEKIKSMLPKSYQLKLTRSEEEGLSEGPSSPGSLSATMGTSLGRSGAFKHAINLSSTMDSLASTNSEEIASAPVTSSRVEPSTSQKSTASAPVKHSAPVVNSHRTASVAAHAAPAAAPTAFNIQNSDVIPVPVKKKIVPPKVQPSSSEALNSKFEKMANYGSSNLVSTSSDTWGGKNDLNRGSMDSQLTTSTMGLPVPPEPAAADSSVEQAVLTLQARVRGTLSRRRSIVHNPFAALASSPQPAGSSGAPSSSTTSAAANNAAAGSSNSAHSSSSGNTSNSTKSSLTSAAPSCGVTFASTVKAASANSSTASSTNNSSLRTPISKRPATTTQPAFCTRTTPAPTIPAPTSIRKTSTGSGESRSVSATRSPRAVSTSAVPSTTPSRARSATKPRAVSTAAGTVEKPVVAAAWKAPANQGIEEVAEPATVLFPKELSINMRVYVVSSKDNSRQAGTILFIGHTAFSAGIWVGVNLDAAAGKNDGSVQGRRYFECPPEHGIFVKEDVVERILHEGPSEGLHRDSSSVTSLETPSLSNSEAVERKGSITGLLKLKLNQMMELLNHQLEIVVELEEEDHKRGSFSHSKRTQDLQAEIVTITNQEQNLINSFKQCLVDRLG